MPSRDYLNHILAPFIDESVGYVAAPSICDANAHTSWAARARLNSEAMFHGPIQAGTNAGWVPICIGSHYAVRTKALKEIGGIGPELAEDYSTTVAMNAHGWRGVLAYDAVAHGDGRQHGRERWADDGAARRRRHPLPRRHGPRPDRSRGVEDPDLAHHRGHVKQAHPRAAPLPCWRP